MTTINLTNIAPPTLSNLIADPLPEGIKLRWDAPDDKTLWQTEVWVSTTNDRSSATLAFSTFDNTYLYTTDGGNTRYFWIKAKNDFLFSNGAWEPTSSTGGVSATALNGNVPGGGTSSASVSSGTSSSSPSITNFDTWYEVRYEYFTAPVKGTITGYSGAKFTSTLPTSGSDGDVMTAYARFRLYDTTDSIDVIGGTYNYVIAKFVKVAGTWTTLIPDQVPQHNYFFNSDLMGHLISGHTYRMYLEVKKERTSGTTGSYTISLNTNWGDTLAGATYG